MENRQQILDEISAVRSQVGLLIKHLNKLYDMVNGSDQVSCTLGHKMPPMGLEITERARYLMTLPFEARADAQPNLWPEMIEALEVYKSATGRSGSKLGWYSADGNTRALVVLFAAGHSLEAVKTGIRNVIAGEWWTKRVGEGSTPGLSSITPVVFERSMDRSTELRHQADARRRVATEAGIGDPSDPDARRNTKREVRGLILAYARERLESRQKYSDEQVTELCQKYWFRHSTTVDALMGRLGSAAEIAKVITNENPIKGAAGTDAGQSSSKSRSEVPPETNQ